ncbi:MAG: DUF3107 domain-containing protein [Actinomycetota bacterium]|nr:DUF3107 domain-containing protein [Actinomycetota bacterium]
MEIKIGVTYSSREIALDSEDKPADVAKAVDEAIASGGVLKLNDDKGRTVLVPAEKIAYVEIGPSSARKVGFGR